LIERRRITTMRRRFFVFALLTSLLAAQDNPSSSSRSETGTLTKKQIDRRQRILEAMRMSPWRSWLSQDVFYIITDDEKLAFKQLRTDEERLQFMEQFWQIRDPSPDTPENEYKDEHYRRIGYANEHYSSGIPGWKTDQGMIYIKYGPPDEIVVSAGSSPRPGVDGVTQTSTYPVEIWSYRYVKGFGSNTVIPFVDSAGSGEYHLPANSLEKDALLHTPGMDQSLLNSMSTVLSYYTPDGIYYTPNGIMHLSTSNQPRLPEGPNEFSRLDPIISRLQKPRTVKFKDLEAIAESATQYQTPKYQSPPMQVRADCIRVTNMTSIASLNIQFKNNVAPVNLYGRITSSTGGLQTWFEDTVQMTMPLYSKLILLSPGTYRLNIVAKDTVHNTINNFETPLVVPCYDDEQLAASSIILADQLERLPAKSIGTGPLVIRDSKVRPRIDKTFKQGESMAIYTEFYNFGMDEKTHEPSGSIQYEVVNMANNQTVMSQIEDLGSIPNASAFLVIVAKKLPSKSLPPGTYKLQMTVTDKVKNQTLTPSESFIVTT
jgi:GWxTD domain-containing protein